MDKELKDAVSCFCEMLPNLSELHHPLDCSRLLKIVYLSFKNNTPIPYSQIKKGIEENISCQYGGTIDNFMKSCEEYAEFAISVLADAQRINILK